jgi:hypothetical protein
MAELGSVFEDEGEDEGPCGPDLRVSVEVPRVALGATFRAPVPLRIAADGELVERAQTDDDPERIVLHLPEELPERALLRLRKQGGVHPEGPPGDLLVLVELVDRPPRDGEEITAPAKALVQQSEQGLAFDTRDVTWWVLLGLALIGGAVLVILAL